MSPVPFRHLDTYGPRACACKLRVLALVILALALAAPLHASEPVRIVVLGDSLVAGYGLDADQGFVPQLGRWLEDNGAPPVDLVNMGVSGDITAGGRARLDWALADGADAVVLALGGNDALRGISPAETRRNLDAMLAELESHGLPVLLIGIRAPTNFGPGYKAAFDAAYPELAEAHGALLAWWHLQRLAGEPGMVQADGLHPSAAGVTEIVGWLGPAVMKLIGRVKG